MIRALTMVAILSAAACKREQPTPKATSTTTSPVPARTIDGVRAISVEVNADGYTPARIAGKPNEKLVLEFTRTVDAACVEQLKTPNGDVVDLPLNKPVKVAVTVPATGEVGFACGMDMVRGAVVAQP